jgi:hypothetical protein
MLLMERKLLLALLLVFTSFSAFAGGPWPRAKGSGYAQLSGTYIGYSKIFDANSDIVSLRRSMTDVTIQTYVEYGITDKLTFTANLPFKYASSSDNVNATDYFADTLKPATLFGLNTVLMGLKYNVVGKKFLLTVGLNTEMNVGRSDSITSIRTGPSTFVFHPYLSTGTSFGKFYTQLEAGYRIRLNGYSHEVDLGYELGYSWNEKTYFILNVRGRVSMQNGSFDNNVTPDHPYGRDIHTMIDPNNQTYLGYGLKFIQKIKKVHINAGVYSGYGQLVAAAPCFNLGVAYEW